MRVEPECVPCIYRSRVLEIAVSGLPNDEKIAAMRLFTEFYSLLLAPGVATTVLAWRAFSKVKELLGDEDPYRVFKEESHRAALSLVEEIRRAAEKRRGFDRLRFLVKASVAANMLDPGSPMGLEPAELIRAVEEVRFGRDELGHLFTLLLQSSKVTYILDNSGEALFDMLVLEELRRMGLKLSVVARGKPYQNDITYEEALAAGFDKLGRLVSSGSDFPGVVPGFSSEEAVRAVAEADLVISKGMANFESFLLPPPSEAHLRHTCR
uniref:DUF89 family protein n=1 Tax=Thermofilum pendens TaxID=2269 RepID=A0A7C3WTH2_THEPE